MIIGKILIISILLLILIGPAFIVLFLFITQVLIRILAKVIGIKGPAPSFLGPLLDSDFRRAFQNPKKIISRSGIRKGMKVLEVGCGSGAYTTFVAREIGPEGEEYALDIQKEMLDQLKRKLARQENWDIKNVTLVESSVYNIPFEENFFDLVFLVSVLNQIPDEQKALGEIKRVLKPNGLLAVTEIMTDPYYCFKSTIIKKGLKAGFNINSVLGNIFHHTIRFRK